MQCDERLASAEADPEWRPDSDEEGVPELVLPVDSSRPAISNGQRTEINRRLRAKAAERKQQTVREPIPDLPSQFANLRVELHHAGNESSDESGDDSDWGRRSKKRKSKTQSKHVANGKDEALRQPKKKAKQSTKRKGKGKSG